MPATTPSEYLAHEMAGIAFKECLLQDANTLEATQSMLESGVVDRFPVGDQEVLCPALIEEANRWINAYEQEQVGG